MKEKSIVRVLIEVNSSGEESKYGFPLDSAFNSIKEIKNLPGIEVLGIMTIGPLTQDVYRIRESFRKTRELFEMLKQELNGNIKYLSMGMSDDYTIAIEEGSNMIRIGRAIFGERH
jgi:pyridoxal phosphate enzyme (YggS family)